MSLALHPVTIPHKLRGGLLVRAGPQSKNRALPQPGRPARGPGGALGAGTKASAPQLMPMPVVGKVSDSALQLACPRPHAGVRNPGTAYAREKGKARITPPHPYRRGRVPGCTPAPPAELPPAGRRPPIPAGSRKKRSPFPAGRAAPAELRAVRRTRSRAG